MRLGIKAKQVLGVTSIVGVVVVALSLMHLAALARHGHVRRRGEDPRDTCRAAYLRLRLPEPAAWTEPGVS